MGVLRKLRVQGCIRQHLCRDASAKWVKSCASQAPLPPGHFGASLGHDRDLPRVQWGPQDLIQPCGGVLPHWLVPMLYCLLNI